MIVQFVFKEHFSKRTLPAGVEFAPDPRFERVPEPFAADFIGRAVPCPAAGSFRAFLNVPEKLEVQVILAVDVVVPAEDALPQIGPVKTEAPLYRKTRLIGDLAPGGLAAEAFCEGSSESREAGVFGGPAHPAAVVPAYEHRVVDKTVEGHERQIPPPEIGGEAPAVFHIPEPSVRFVGSRDREEAVVPLPPEFARRVISQRVVRVVYCVNAAARFRSAVPTSDLDMNVYSLPSSFYEPFNHAITLCAAHHVCAGLQIQRSGELTPFMRCIRRTVSRSWAYR